MQELKVCYTFAWKVSTTSLVRNELAFETTKVPVKYLYRSISGAQLCTLIPCINFEKVTDHDMGNCMENRANF